MAIAPTLSDLDLAPEPEPQGFYEVVDGLVVEKPPMGALEGWIASMLDQAMGPIARRDRRGIVVVEILFLIDRASNLRRRPDLAFVTDERWSVDRPIPRTAAWDVVPDLVVEVISPTDLADDVMARLEDFFRFGTRRVWVIYPGQGKFYDYDSPTSVRILTAAEAIEGGEIVPGFRLPLSELFRGEAGSPRR